MIAEGIALLISGARRGRRGGRPKAIDAEMRARIATLMGAGLSLRQAGACLGIAHTTISRAVEGDADLKEEVELARTQATLHPLACILRESGKNWKAAVWLLEHLRQVSRDEMPPLERARAYYEMVIRSNLSNELMPQFMAEARRELDLPPKPARGR